MVQFEAVLIEDNHRVVNTMRRKLLELGCILVGHSPDSEEGFELVIKFKPQIVIIDLHLKDGEGKGIEVANRIRSKFPEMGIIILTASGVSADEIYENAIGLNHLVRKSAGPESASIFPVVKTLLQRTFFLNPHRVFQKNIKLSFVPNQPIHIAISGQPIIRTHQNYLYDVNGAIALNADLQGVQSLQQDRQIPKLRKEGKNLYQVLFKGYPQILNSYHQLNAGVGEKDVHFEIESDHSSNALPFELLHDERIFLPLKHPFLRTVTGYGNYNRGVKISPDYFRVNSQKPDHDIRILLVASDTGNIPGVEAEIMKLSQGLKQKLRYNLSFQVKTLLTKDAHLSGVIEELRKGAYDILHYAGHGVFDEKDPENSALIFWSEPEKKGSIERLTARELFGIVSELDLKFVYLSCCLGSATSPAYMRYGNNFLGIADSLLSAGVPTVLGYRWAVSDRNALILATEFYKSLLSQGDPAVALYQARRTIYFAPENAHRMDSLSPILWNQ
ncbi:MAG: CHAT domain-containing protein [Bacteroidota bacterium]